jgi:hypothetical protein
MHTDRQRRRSRFVAVAKGDPSKAAPLTTQRVFMGVMYLLWDVGFFFAGGHVLVGIALLVVPLSWFGLAWRARSPKATKSLDGSYEGPSS